MQMFWGGIRFNGRTQIIHIPGTMTGAYYQQNNINVILQPLRNEIGDQFNFMEIMPGPIAPEPFNKHWKTERLQDWNGRQCPLT
nr:unnamed protein product [Callosobruchus chinensis]